jgi:hypothetical protein
MKEVYSAARTWGELQADLNSAGVRYEGMRVMTNPGQVTLESLQAELPQGEFQLFIMPQKVKSGYFADDDADMIDEHEGIDASDEDWSVEDPEGYIFTSHKQLAIARSKRAFALLEKTIEYLTDSNNGPKPATKAAPRDPLMDSLREQARNLQNNMMFD